jgi:regulator of sigma E protease
MSFFLTSTVSMLVVLGIMVLVHEFGHFAVAKLCGVRVEVFSIGFGKRLFGFRR